MRFGLTILPELPWSELRPRWEATEAMGFDHAWTYDHLVWGGLPDSPWYGTTSDSMKSRIIDRNASWSSL